MAFRAQDGPYCSRRLEGEATFTYHCWHILSHCPSVVVHIAVHGPLLSAFGVPCLSAKPQWLTRFGQEMNWATELG
jgi:hypothetical protein